MKLVQYDNWPVMTLKQFLRITYRLAVVKRNSPLEDILDSIFVKKIFTEELR